MVDVCINHKSNLFPFLPILPHTMLNTQICALCKNWTVMIMIIRRYCFGLFRIHYRNSVLNVIKCLIIMMGHSVPGLIWMELLRISSESFLCPDELSSSNILPSHDHSNIRKQFYNYLKLSSTDFGLPIVQWHWITGPCVQTVNLLIINN